MKYLTKEGYCNICRFFAIGCYNNYMETILDACCWHTDVQQRNALLLQWWVTQNDIKDHLLWKILDDIFTGRYLFHVMIISRLYFLGHYDILLYFFGVLVNLWTAMLGGGGGHVSGRLHRRPQFLGNCRVVLWLVIFQALLYTRESTFPWQVYVTLCDHINVTL